MSKNPGQRANRTATTKKEAHAIEDRSRLRTPIVYEILRQEGEEEMSRPFVSLWWSGIAAGLSISFSLLAQSLLFMALPDLPWRRLVTSLGYSVGFLMVVLGRQQLFTENTLTVVLPLMARPAFAVLARTARMWSIVLAANLTGTFFAAAFCAFTPVLTPEIRAAMIEVSRNAVLMAGPLETGFHGITAGFLIAAMVWMIPSGKGGEFWIIVAMTYLIGIGNYAHIVAGSMEAFMLMLSGVAPPGAVAVSYLLPALAGNIIGGTALFAVISYAQVMEEI